METTLQKLEDQTNVSNPIQSSMILVLLALVPSGKGSQSKAGTPSSAGSVRRSDCYDQWHGRWYDNFDVVHLALPHHRLCDILAVSRVFRQGGNLANRDGKESQSGLDGWTECSHPHHIFVLFVLACNHAFVDALFEYGCLVFLSSPRWRSLERIASIVASQS